MVEINQRERKGEDPLPYKHELIRFYQYLSMTGIMFVTWNSIRKIQKLKVQKVLLTN